MQIPTVVVDPVMVTSHLSPSNLTIIRNQLLPVATLITPTRNEAEILLDSNIVSLEDMKRAAQDLHHLGPKYVLIKGDHLDSDASLQTQADGNENTMVIDVLYDGLQFTLFKSSHIPTTNTHDPWCTLSAAITAYLAHGLDMIRAIQYAIVYTHSAIQTSSVLNRDNDLLKNDLHLLVDELPHDSLCQNDKHKLSVINEPEEQQKSQLENADKVVIVSNQCWIHEPRILLQKRSFLQVLKNACAQEWVCSFALFSVSLCGKKRLIFKTGEIEYTAHFCLVRLYPPSIRTRPSKRHLTTRKLQALLDTRLHLFDTLCPMLCLSCVQVQQYV
jgi:hypothetical protein